MAQSGTDQHEGGVAVREASHHVGMAVDLPIEFLNDIVGSDTSPVLAGEITVGQCFFNAVRYLLGSLLQLHRAQLLYYSFGFLPGCFLALLGVDRFEYFCHQLYLGTGRYREDIAVEVDGSVLVLGFGESISHNFQHTKALVTNHQFNSS